MRIADDRHPAWSYGVVVGTWAMLRDALPATRCRSAHRRSNGHEVTADPRADIELNDASG